jgi:hypothetical protein
VVIFSLDEPDYNPSTSAIGHSLDVPNQLETKLLVVEERNRCLVFDVSALTGRQ